MIFSPVHGNGIQLIRMGMENKILSLLVEIKTPEIKISGVFFMCDYMMEASIFSTALLASARSAFVSSR